MLPPPSSTHASWQALHDYAQSHASEHGYALSINTTAKNRSRIKLACVCYGQPKNTHKLTPETRVRKNRASYKTGCNMWIEGKKQEDGTWLLRVGESQHNHPGRASQGWAVQRKRTWGVVGGRIGVGGVTAKEELAKLTVEDDKEHGDQAADEDEEELELPPMAIHRLEHGGLVWRIVEREMLRKGEPNQGRDRGVGRTVEVLQSRLPGIHIFKRDVYNMRAQIKRARKAAGQQVGEGLNDSDHEDEEPVEHVDPQNKPHAKLSSPHQDLTQRRRSELCKQTTYALPQIDPSLTTPQDGKKRASTSAHAQSEEFELRQLKEENAELRRLLGEKTKELKEKTIEIAGLRSQADYMAMMGLSSARGGMAG